MSKWITTIVLGLMASTTLSCRTTTSAPDTAELLEATGPCAAEANRVQSLKVELAELEKQKEPNPQGKAACDEKAGAQWNTEIGRCECISDPSKFTANAWSIRNTLHCAANTDGFNACREKSGAEWNSAIGRCECVTDRTKFTANAWSIRNTLKCEGNMDGYEACKAKSGTRWNSEIGRCECTTDPTKFSGNAWSIRNTLNCEANTSGFDACKEKAGARWNNEVGRCECLKNPNNFQANAWSIRNVLSCNGGGVAGLELNRPASNSNTEPTLDEKIAAIKQSLGDAESKLKKCLEQQNAEQTEPPSSSGCKCGWDSKYQYCVVWKQGRALTPYFGPLAQGRWNCTEQDGHANNLCKTQSSLNLLRGPQCR